MGIKQELFNDYDAFVGKFEPKKTTDDCYTPPAVYDVVLAWARKRYAIPEDAPIVRPFFPGGDYENAEYPKGCVVVDNPPFSIMAKIVRFYQSRKIPFFIFANGLTLFSSLREDGVGAVVIHSSITYENGAVVNTGFLTNMSENILETAPDLGNAIKAVNKKRLLGSNPQALRKINYPSAVISGATAKRLASHGIKFSVRFGDAAYIRKLDAQRVNNGIFGSGLLLSEREAAEREAVTVLELSPREREIQRLLGRRDG